MSISPLEYLRHILDETAFLMDQVKGMTKDQLLQNETLKRAVVRSLEVIGEAVKKVPLEFRQKYDHIDWRSIAGMRDRLIHGYFEIDYDIVWEVVTEKIPVLKQEIQQIIQDESRS
jgi:uncharacterized protein with HEPN domain